jgi:S1-C subfamily serine protease
MKTSVSDLARRQRARRPLQLAGSLSAAALLASCALGPASPGPSQPAAAPPAGSAVVAGVQTQGTGRDTPAVAVFRQNGPSVVNITSLAMVRTAAGTSERPQGTGSGWFLDAEGRIVTNNHVVEDATQLSVTLADRTTVPATLIGRDPDNDLAVVQIDPNAQDENGRSIRDRVRPVTLGDSSRVTIGEDVVAIGSPLGLQQSVTSGIVSAIRTPSEEIQAAGGEPILLGGAIQTDAAINPGNSGGPLFNAAGEMIGVNTAGLSQSGGSIGLNFAIPVNVVKRVVPELIARGCYRHPLVGISAVPLSQIGTALKEQIGVPANQKGLLVQEASAGAAAAGLRGGTQAVNVPGGQLRVGGDIVVAIDGNAVAAGGDLRSYVENSKRPGDTVRLTVQRGAERVELNVQLSERPPSVPCR